MFSLEIRSTSWKCLEFKPLVTQEQANEIIRKYEKIPMFYGLRPIGKRL